MASIASFRLRATAFEAGVLVLALVTLGLASTYAVELYRAPLAVRRNGSIRGFDWSTAWAVFFYGTTPVVTVFAAAAGIFLYLFRGATPLYGVTVSTIFLVGWIITVSLWINCHYWNIDIASSDFCYQKSLRINGGYVGLSNDLAGSLTAFSVFVMVAYLLYVLYASIILRRIRKVGLPDTDYKAAGGDSSD